MNRSLAVPAGCCLFALIALLAAFHRVGGGETAVEPSRRDRVIFPSTRTYTATVAPNATGVPRLSSREAEQVLTQLANAYQRPWRQWASSPRRLYSRAAPRPIPTITTIVEMSPSPIGQSEGTLLATIAVTTGATTQPVPCVVDRTTRQVRLFAEGQWLTEDEWLTKAPLP